MNGEKFLISLKVPTKGSIKFFYRAVWGTEHEQEEKVRGVRTVKLTD